MLNPREGIWIVKHARTRILQNYDKQVIVTTQGSNITNFEELKVVNNRRIVNILHWHKAKTFSIQLNASNAKDLL